MKRLLWPLLIILAASAAVVYYTERRAEIRRLDREAARLLAGEKGAVSPAAPEKGLPTLVNFGAETCPACRAIKPIIEALQQEYAGRIAVQIVDVYEHRDLAEKYGIYLIPTQIFLDPEGKILFRHEGFWPREDILGKFREFGWIE